MTLIDEILSQPDLLRELATGHAARVSTLQDTIPLPTCATIIARGTSDNAGLYAKYLWGMRNRLSVSLATPSLYTAYASPLLLPEGCLVVAISQSGESPDLVAAFAGSGDADHVRLALTNEIDSPLARAATVVSDLGAGQETAVAATRTYVAELLAVLQLSLAWDSASCDIDAVADCMDMVIAEQDVIAEAAEAFVTSPGFAVIGRGFNLATAYEWALKLTETAGVNARPFSTADFLHGPVAMVDHDLPILAIAMGGAVDHDVPKVVSSLTKQRGTRGVLITNVADAEADFVISVPEIDEILSPFVAIVAGQLFSYYLAKARGLDPDSPLGLTKVTHTF